MQEIVILLDIINYKIYKGNPHFRNIRLTGHYESALQFQKNNSNEFLNITIIKNNHRKNLEIFVDNSKPDEELIIIYCGHGNPRMWCIGINRDTLLNICNKVKNNVTIISDSCFSDTMNIANSRKNTTFLSAARSSGENCYAFFTCDGGFLSISFYKYFQHGILIKELWEKILTEYYDDGKKNLHQPKIFYFLQK